MHEWARERFAAARVAHLATTSSAGPHVVPVVFALAGDHIWTAIDDKPKSGRPLRRLANIAGDPRVSVLVDHYEDDWTQLWWVRADGTAAVVAADAHPDALAALADKYAPYAVQPPPGPLIRIGVDTWRSWSAR